MDSITNNTNTNDLNNNRFNIVFEGEENTETLLSFKEKYEDALFESTKNDISYLRKIEKRKMLSERNEDLMLAIRELRNEMRRSNRENREDLKVVKEDLKVVKEDLKVVKEDLKVVKEDLKVVKEDIRRLSYRNMVVENSLLASANKPIQVVPFLTGEGPNEDNLPPIRNIVSINNMNEEDVVSYLRGYNVDRLPASLLAKKKKLAALVGLAHQDNLLL